MSYVYEHHVLAIYPQDKWKNDFKSVLSEGVREAFFKVSGAASCDICCTCEVCRGLAELFDPNNASEYNNVCKLCFIFEKYFKDKFGTNEGIVLMAHWNNMPDGLIELLYKEKHIKKVYVLNHNWKGNERVADAEKILGDIRDEKISYSGFMSLTQKEPGVVYEIIRDEYMK
jgi:hypothetical protein